MFIYFLKYIAILNYKKYFRITCVDLSPQWPNKRTILTGGSDGTVKQWSIDYQDHKVTIKPTHAHEAHSIDKEVSPCIFLNETYWMEVHDIEKGKIIIVSNQIMDEMK